MKVGQTNNGSDYGMLDDSFESDDIPSYNKIVVNNAGNMYNKKDNYAALANDPQNNDLLINNRDNFQQFSEDYLSNNPGMSDINKKNISNELGNPYMFEGQSKGGNFFDLPNSMTSNNEQLYYNTKDREMQRFSYMNGSGKSRSRTSTEQLLVLEQICKSTLRPNKETRIKLAKDLNMNQRQVQIWFQNKRAKLKKGFIDDVYYTGKKDEDFVVEKRVNNGSSEFGRTSNIYNQQPKFAFSNDFSSKQDISRNQKNQDSYTFSTKLGGGQDTRPRNSRYLIQPNFSSTYDYSNNNSFTTTYLRNYCSINQNKTSHDGYDISHYYTNKGTENPNKASHSDYVNLNSFLAEGGHYDESLQGNYYLRQSDYEYEKKDYKRSYDL